MAKVADLKNHARDLERQGQIAKALAIYRHIIKHLEGTPHILRELALYVKTGDLALKLEDAPGAIESYERAAEHYASHGSENSVIALCQKILRVAPDRKGVHARYARILMGQGHISGARDVLIEYAESAQLTYALETLRGLSKRSDDEARPALEALLDAAEGGHDREVERTSREVVPQMFSNTAELAARMTAPKFTKREDPPTPLSEPPAPLVQEPIGGFSGVDEPASIEATASPDDDPSIPKIEPTTGPTLRVPTPRKPQRAIRQRVPLASQAAREGESNKKWVIAAIAVLSVGAAGALAFMGVIPLPDALRLGGGGGGSGGGDQTEPVAAAQTPATNPGTAETPAPGDTALSAAADDSVATAIADTVDTLPPVTVFQPIDTLRTLRNPALGQAAVPDTLGAAVGEPGIDTTPAPPAAAPLDTSAARPDPDRPTILAIFGLPVDSVTVYAAEGIAGYRVHQTTRGGEQILLAVLPLGDDATDTVGMGPIFVNPLAGDTVMGTVRVGRYRVSATGAVSTAVLDSLMQQILERRSPGR